jgi:hypothetical protein
LRKSYNKEGLAHIPRSIAAINTVHTTTEEEAIQLCKLVVQQREGTKIDGVSLQHVGTDFYAVLLRFSFCSVQFPFGTNFYADVDC